MLLHSQMLIGLGIMRIERVLMEHVSLLETIVSWLSEKQSCICLSTAEVEYVAAGGCCQQIVWMKQMLEEYGMGQKEIVLYCENVSAINIAKNHVQHSWTKHIDIKYRFIRELVEQKLIILEHVLIDTQQVDIFTKPLAFAPLEVLHLNLGLCKIDA